MNDLTDVLEALGVEVTGESADRVFGLCPGHEERVGRPDTKPSWSMDRDLHVHHCWSCGYAGTLRGLVADVGGAEAVTDWLADFTRDRAVRRLRAKGRRAEPPELPALTAAEKRLERFGEPPDEALRARGLERFAVAHYGIRWDPAREHWIIPVHDDKGVLAGYQRKGEGYFKNWPKGLQKSQMLFGLGQLHGAWAVLVESPLDVVRLYSEGVEGGVSSYGAYVSDAQLRLLLDPPDGRRPVEDLVLALDDDEAGNAERDRIWKAWRRRGVRLRALDYGGVDGKDVGEMTPEQVRRLTVHPRRWRPAEREDNGRRRAPVGERLVDRRDRRRRRATA